MLNNRRATQGNILVFFLQDTLKTAFSIINLLIDAYKQGTLFQNQGIFFAKLGDFSYIFKKGQGRPTPFPPPANCAPGYICCLFDYL